MTAASPPASGNRERLLVRARLAVAIAFAFGSAFHLVAVFWPATSPGDSAARHGVFVGVDAALALGFARPPRWLALPVALLTAQQLVSHGGDILRAWHDAARIDGASVAVIATMLVSLAVALADGLRRRA